MDWSDLLAEEKSKPYFKAAVDYVNTQRAQNKIIYPKNDNIFNAFKLTPLESVKVVILGQDPYHGIDQAHGLCFSVPKGIPAPPSLKNIFKEMNQDLNLTVPQHGCLESWAKQGVLLLNTILTVEQHRAHSHKDIGWGTFTDVVIAKLSQCKPHLIFLLWGSHAIKKSELIDKTKHSILTAPHPSPLSAHRGFLGCQHFSKTNKILDKKQQQGINWNLVS
ncbi:MAG TPA: uracil-DNA glycosylase [Gammaproteobacteria bacterium]|nr:uracil-DNA glycosylase [Gammaproteobacteria bacterium]